MKNLILATLIISIFCFSDCKKNTIDSNGLPKATQEGKNTLGFLLNGQPWTPKGFNGTANLSIDYNAGIANGGVGISAYRIVTSDEREYFKIGITDSINTFKPPYTISLKNDGLFRIGLSDNQCTLYSFDNTTVSGSISITKLDRTNRIISGLFDAILKKTGCKEINITEGRFDMKF